MFKKIVPYVGMYFISLLIFSILFSSGFFHQFDAYMLAKEPIEPEQTLFVQTDENNSTPVVLVSNNSKPPITQITTEASNNTIKLIEEDILTAFPRVDNLPEDSIYFINLQAESLEIDPILIAAIIYHESGWKSDAVGTSGEIGLMQVMEGTLNYLIDTNPHALGIYSKEDRDDFSLYHPGDAILAGTNYLKLLTIDFSDANAILTGYNRGYYGCIKYFNKYGTYESKYSRSVLRNYKKLEEVVYERIEKENFR